MAVWRGRPIGDHRFALRHPVRHSPPGARRERLIVDFETTGRSPPLATTTTGWTASRRCCCDMDLMKLRKTPAYRGAIHTLSVLTITFNVVYGKKTGTTPDGRQKGDRLPRRQPHAQPREVRRAGLAQQVAKLSYDDCRDGISNTFSITPQALGPDADTRVDNLVRSLWDISARAHIT